MKNVFLAGAAAAALSMFAGGAQAADMDYDKAIQSLVVSGVVEKWVGYTFADGTDNGGAIDMDKDSYLASGMAGRLSLPLGSNLSMQMDASIEYTDAAFDSANSDNTFKFASQFGAHLTYRDPSSFALGALVGFGGGNTENEPYDSYIIGGEAQIYTNDLTFYVQAGFLDSIDRSGNQDNALNDAFFGRGVVRWYMDPNSRLQAEFAYAAGKQDDDDDDMDVIAWGVRYDTMIAGLPIIGDTNVFVGYRGNYAEVFEAPGDTDNADYMDHTIMIGTSHSFGGGSMQETERRGAGFDLPDFGRWIGLGPIVD